MHVQAIKRLIADDEWVVAADESEMALRLHPQSSVLHCLCATTRLALRDVAGALTLLQEGAVRVPNEAGILIALGELHASENGDVDQAMACFESAIRLEPGKAERYAGYADYGLGQSGFDKVWKERPVWMNSGLLGEALLVQLRNRGLYSDAKAFALQLLERFGRRPGTLLSLARIEVEAEHDCAAARRYAVAALQLEPASFPGHLVYIALLIREGKWGDAGRHLRSILRRFEHFDATFARNTPLLDGSPLHDTTVLLDSMLASGYGDFIHFSRLAGMLKERGATVGIRTRRALKGVMANVSGVDFVIGHSETLNAVHFTADMSLLWILLGLQMDEVATNVPYVRVDPHTLSNRKRPDDRELRIGLVTRSADQHPSNRHTAKNIPDSELAPLQAIPRARFFSFEMPRLAPPLQQVFTHAAVETVVAGFTETAVMLSQMDVVITVDTALAHLTGAIGKRGVLLLPYSPDWRWMLDRSDTPWYPSIHLIRQAAPGDWRSVIDQCTTALGAC